MQTLAKRDERQGDRVDLTDEKFVRIDERFDRVDERLVDVDRRITETATETNRRLKEVDRRITETSAETNRRLEVVNDLKQEMKALQITFQRGNFALIASVFGVLVATILKGG